MKFSGIISALTLTGAVAAPHQYTITTIAGIEVIYTRLLFGAAAMNANETLKNWIDLELHAVGTLLHDLGWDSMLLSQTFYGKYDIVTLMHRLQSSHEPSTASHINTEFVS
ncbi:hypothetical protein GGS21DRAFT_494389 [Xylaria nigripes]|nr:hypothetical protein GGS21DRAFT_494389 [Xylaria nigripes]